MERKNVGIISRWNATCGVSLHAESIGRELINRGYNIKVFAPYLASAMRWWHHISTKEDEDYVIRCFEESAPDGSPGWIERHTIESHDIDYLVVESWASLPKRDVEQLVFTMTKRGVPSYLVIHEGYEKDLRYTNLNIFDRIIIFHRGFFRMLSGKVDGERVVIIPYPCTPPWHHLRAFGSDGRIVFFSFGRQPVSEYHDYIEVLRELREQFPEIIYRVIRADFHLPFQDEWIEQKRKPLDFRELVDYLNGADVHLIPKGHTNGIVVSSTMCQTIGSLCPSVAPATAHFEDVLHSRMEPPIILYENRAELKDKLERLITDSHFRQSLVESARRYSDRFSVKNIVDSFESLFKSCLPPAHQVDWRIRSTVSAKF
jgi:hypothetical protein